LVSLAANLAVVPLLGAATGLGMLSVLSGWCLPWVATAFNGANYLVLKLAILVVDLFAGLPFASVRTPRPGPLFAAWVTLCWWLAVRSSGRRRAAKPLVFALLVGANAAVWSPVWGPRLRPPRLEVSFLDVGQGDAALLRFPNGATLLVDGGDRSPQLDSGQRILLPFLRWAGVGRLDAVVATHPHDDHIGGLVAVLEQLPVGHYLDSGQAGNSAAAARLRELVAARGIRYHRVSAGDRVIGLGGATATVLHPGPAWVDTAGPAPRGLNNASVVLRVDYGQVRILLAGDAEDEADAALLGWGEGLAATILKVPHHGSPTSCQPAFATAVRPRLALVSVGEGNRFRHPDRQVLERLDRGGAQVFRTDRDGALQVWSDGSRIETRAMVRE
jgi:competence protein ComEC